MSDNDISSFNDFLEHYGTMGMKWGVRKSPTSVDYKQTKHLRRRNPKELSNKQIKKVNERLKLEKTYKTNNPHPVAQGLKAAGAIVTAIGTITSIYKLRNNAIFKDAISAGSKVASRIIRERSNVPFEQLTLF